MTSKGAQAELLRLLGGSSQSSTVQSLTSSLAGVAPQAQLLGGAITSGLGGTAGDGSLLGGLIGGAASGGGSGVLNGLLGISPILSGIRDLFGGSSQQAAPAFTKYAAPDPINLSLGLTNGGQNLATSSGQSGTGQVAPAITVNVSAMDSRSFSDNSDQIAQAVRQAMLNSGALTDVVTEL